MVLLEDDVFSFFSVFGWCQGCCGYSYPESPKLLCTQKQDPLSVWEICLTTRLDTAVIINLL